jgi:cell division septal protein FtsQ
VQRGKKCVREREKNSKNEREKAKGLLSQVFFLFALFFGAGFFFFFFFYFLACRAFFGFACDKKKIKKKEKLC